MQDLDKIAHLILDPTAHHGRTYMSHADVRKWEDSRAEQVEKFKKAARACVQFVAEARVAERKPRVGKKRITGRQHCQERKISGLMASPTVVLRSARAEIKMACQFSASPFVLETEWSNGTHVYSLTDRPWVPMMFIETKYDSPMRLVDLRCWEQERAVRVQPLVDWFLESCPRLPELDEAVRRAWENQWQTLDKVVREFIDGSSDKQKQEFRKKLAKEFESCKNVLAGMSPPAVHEIFKLARDHSDALDQLVRFCRRNSTDAIWIDESDIQAAMDLARVSEVMGS